MLVVYFAIKCENIKTEKKKLKMRLTEEQLSNVVCWSILSK